MASELLEQLVKLLGHQPTIELLRAMGGRRIKIPEKIHQDTALVYIVGWDAANRLSAEYAGDTLDLPAERNLLIDLRNGAIVAEFLRGRSRTWLAQTFGLSRRHVNQVLDRLGHEAERRARSVATRT